MAKVRNRVVKAKSKKNSRKARGKSRAAAKSGRIRGLEARITGFNLEKFSNDILENRNAHGLTQRELGAKTGMTSACVVHIENQKSSPLVQNFARLCQFFKLPPGNYINVK